MVNQITTGPALYKLRKRKPVESVLGGWIYWLLLISFTAFKQSENKTASPVFLPRRFHALAFPTVHRAWWFRLCSPPFCAGLRLVNATADNCNLLPTDTVNFADIRSAVPVSHDRRGGAGGGRTHYLVCRRVCIVYPPAIAWALHPRYPPANLRVTIHAAAPCVYVQSVIPPQAGGPAHTDRPTCPPKRRYQATLLSPRPVRCQP